MPVREVIRMSRKKMYEFRVFARTKKEALKLLGNGTYYAYNILEA